MSRSPCPLVMAVIIFMNHREYIKKELYRLKIGEYLKLDRHMFNDAFPCGFPSIYRTHEQAFLSTMIGSGWGAWRIRQDFETGDYIITRHQEENKRYYVDPDREHLFRKLSDGTLEKL